MDTAKMLVNQPAGYQESNSIPHATQQELQESTGLPASSIFTGSLEPKTGEHLMESCTPEESATTSHTTYRESLPGPSTEDSRTHQPYPHSAKRQRTATTREYLNQRAQQLIDDINEKRKADTMLLADFKKSMEMQIATSYGVLEQSMYHIYERNGKIMQSKLQELFTTLDRISKLEAELQEFKQALGALYTDIQLPS